MRLLRVAARDFLSYRDVDLDLSDLRTVAVVGKNGSGKSSLAIEIPRWGLYGKSRAGSGKFILETAEQCEVQVDFEARGHIVNVARTATSNGRGSTLSLMVDGVSQTAHTMDETQARITELIGLEYEAMRAGPMMVQFESGYLMGLSPTRGMELLIDCFGAAGYQPYADEASGRASGYAREAQDLGARLAEAQEIAAQSDEANRELAVARHDLSVAKMERDEFLANVSSLREKQASLREKVRHAETLRQTVSTVSSRIKSDRTETERMLRQISDAHNAKDAPEPTFPELEEVTPDQVAVIEAGAADMEQRATKRQVIEAQVPILRSQLETMESRRSIVDTVPCHGVGDFAACRFLIDAASEGEISTLRQKVEAAEAAVLDLPQVHQADEFRKTAREQREKLTRYEKEKERRASAIAQWRLQVEHATQVATNGADSLNRLENQIARDQQILIRAREQLNGLNVDQSSIDQINVDIEAAQAGATQRSESISLVYEPAVITATQRVKVVEDARASVDDLRKREKEASGKADVYKTLAKAFHRDGIPSLIVENGIPLIEERANDILSRMPDNYRVRLHTQREKRGGGMMDRLNIVVEANGRERDYELLSGGEKFRIDFSLRVALARALTQRAGTTIDTLFIDEGFGSQDDDGVEAMLESLAAVQDDFGLIIIITHQETVMKRVDSRIEVSRDEDGSRYELVA